MITRLSEIIEYNEIFVENKYFEEFMTTRYPDKRMVILSCMDTRLVELLPKAMNLKNGDAKIIHNAGAILTSPFGNIMRSIIVAVYELQAEEVFVVGHHDCGMTGINPDRITDKMIENGIDPDVIHTLSHSGINLHRFLRGFDSVREGVETSVSIIKNHPLMPPTVPVHGLLIDPVTGKLEVVIDGYTAEKAQ
jgi:carbonic anhydrase